ADGGKVQAAESIAEPMAHGTQRTLLMLLAVPRAGQLGWVAVHPPRLVHHAHGIALHLLQLVGWLKGGIGEIDIGNGVGNAHSPSIAQPSPLLPRTAS